MAVEQDSRFERSGLSNLDFPPYRKNTPKSIDKNSFFWYSYTLSCNRSERLFFHCYGDPKELRGAQTVLIELIDNKIKTSREQPAFSDDGPAKTLKKAMARTITKGRYSLCFVAYFRTRISGQCTGLPLTISLGFEQVSRLGKLLTQFGTMPRGFRVYLGRSTHPLGAANKRRMRHGGASHQKRASAQRSLACRIRTRLPHRPRTRAIVPRTRPPALSKACSEPRHPRRAGGLRFSECSRSWGSSSEGTTSSVEALPRAPHRRRRPRRPPPWRTTRIRRKPLQSRPPSPAETGRSGTTARNAASLSRSCRRRPSRAPSRSTSPVPTIAASPRTPPSPPRPHRPRPSRTTGPRWSRFASTSPRSAIRPSSQAAGRDGQQRMVRRCGLHALYIQQATR